jgi:hypothetical protein
MTQFLQRALQDPRIQWSSLESRFWSKYIPVTESGCWIWEASARPSGYGQFGVCTGVMVSAHRLAYWLANGPFDESLDILHRCDVPACINPSHLWIGTHTDNMHDMRAKGRLRNNRGEDHGCSALTESQVREIRNIYSNGIAQEKIAKHFNISQSNVGNIVRRKTWSHVN